MKYISLILWEIPTDLLNIVLKMSNLSMSPLKAATSQFKMEQKRCRRASKDAPQPHWLPSVTGYAGAGAEEWWRRRGRLAQPLPALIIPKDPFSDHYLLSHTRRHTHITDAERIYKLPSEESLSKHRHHLLQGCLWFCSNG